MRIREDILMTKRVIIDELVVDKFITDKVESEECPVEGMYKDCKLYKDSFDNKLSDIEFVEGCQYCWRTYYHYEEYKELTND